MLLLEATISSILWASIWNFLCWLGLFILVLGAVILLLILVLIIVGMIQNIFE